MSELIPAQHAVPSTPNPSTHSTASSIASSMELGQAPEPVLCHHCGRTASNGISCEGACVADSGY